MNFRAFREVTLELDDYTCLLGPNGVGKSAVVAALDLLLGPRRKVLKSDYHKQDTSTPLRVTLEFSHLSDSAQRDFQHYVRQGVLRIFLNATWDESTGQSKVDVHGVRYGVKAFASCFAAASALELRTHYAELRKNPLYNSLPTYRSQTQVKEELRAYESMHPDECIALPSDTSFYGATGRDLLARHLCWVHVPAVKDAKEESIETASNWLGRLMTHAVRRHVGFSADLQEIEREATRAYEVLMEAKQEALEDFSTKLSSKVRDWSHGGAEVHLRWEAQSSQAIKITPPIARLEAGDDAFMGDISLQGHGFQRSYLIALVQMLADSESQDGDTPTLLLACEEPELYQHPPQAQYLASLLKRMAGQGARVLVCTHSPYFATGDDCDAIRLVKRTTSGESTILAAGTKAISDKKDEIGWNARSTAAGSRAKLHQLLQPSASELFFARSVVLVEGLEDQAFLLSQLRIDKLEEDFQRLGCHIVRCDGTDRLVHLLVVASCYGVPAFVVVDGDRNKCILEPGEQDDRKMRKAASEKQRHELDNRAILHLCGMRDDEPFPVKDKLASNLAMWTDDIGSSVRGCVGEGAYRDARDRALAIHDLSSEGGLQKNSLAIPLIMSELQSRGISVECLSQACKAIIDFAKLCMEPEQGPGHRGRDDKRHGG